MNYLIIRCHRYANHWSVDRDGAPRRSYPTDMAYAPDTDAARVALEYVKDVILSSPLSYPRDKGRPIGAAEVLVVDRFQARGVDTKLYLVVVRTTAVRAKGGF
jgi:hypothetical protein